MVKKSLLIILVLIIFGCAAETKCIPVAYWSTGPTGVNTKTYWFTGEAWQNEMNPRYSGYVFVNKFIGTTERGKHQKHPTNLCDGYPKMPAGYYHVIFCEPGDGVWVLDGEIFMKDGTVWVFPAFLPDRALNKMQELK